MDAIDLLIWFVFVEWLWGCTTVCSFVFASLSCFDCLMFVYCELFGVYFEFPVGSVALLCDWFVFVLYLAVSLMSLCYIVCWDFV